MPCFLESILSGLVADSVFLGLILIVGVFLLRMRTRRLNAFWGTGVDKPITIYVSHLRVQVSPPGGAIDWQGNLRSFQGSVAPLLEAQCASAISNLFRSHFPGRALLPDFLYNALLPSAQATVLASPTAPPQPSPHCVLALGGPGYNSISHHIEASCSSPVRFGANGSSFSTPKGALTQANRSFIVRINQGGRSLFYAAGLSEPGTAASAIYLATRWHALWTTFASGQFYVVLEFPPHDYLSAQVVEQGRV